MERCDICHEMHGECYDCQSPKAKRARRRHEERKPPTVGELQCKINRLLDVIIKLTGERDRLQAKLDAQQPLVDAAMEWGAVRMQNKGFKGSFSELVELTEAIVVARETLLGLIRAAAEAGGEA